MLENYALEEDPLAAFKRRRSQLEEVGMCRGWGGRDMAGGWQHLIACNGCFSPRIGGAGGAAAPGRAGTGQEANGAFPGCPGRPPLAALQAAVMSSGRCHDVSRMSP